MTLTRIARNGLRRSGGAYTSEKDILYKEVSARKYSSPSIDNVTAGGNLSYLSSIRKVDHMSFGSRGISVIAQHQFAHAERSMEESDSEYNNPKYPSLEATKPGEKPRVVVLGTGWAACRFLKGIDTKIYDVVCISPRNHMVFTPLLASTCVGTLEFRTVAEPDGKGLSHAGFVSWLVWRSAYLTRVLSWRNRFYVAVNWATTLVFGRDNSRIG